MTHDSWKVLLGRRKGPELKKDCKDRQAAKMLLTSPKLMERIEKGTGIGHQVLPALPEPRTIRTKSLAVDNQTNIPGINGGIALSSPYSCPRFPLSCTTRIIPSRADEWDRIVDYDGLTISIRHQLPISCPKFELEIKRDLNEMATKWTKAEFEARRRLVHFKRERSGDTIFATFVPVTADTRPPYSVCLSCIYWEKEQACFMTSLDIVYLLEQLFATRVRVEVRKWIRTELEEFQYISVLKDEPDTLGSLDSSWLSRHQSREILRRTLRCSTGKILEGF